MVLIILLLLVWSWFLVRWYMGNTVAEYLNPDDNTLETARMAVALSPNDPLAHWRLGQVTQKKLAAAQLDQAIREYETAVRLSPNDYRFWMSLGTALEQQGDIQKAEHALRRSVYLAPSYSYPAWYLGNLLLRSGRYDEAFTELRRASEGDPELRPQLFNVAWEVYRDDLESMKKAIGTSPEVRAHFSQYLFEHERYDDALRLWNSLSEVEMRANRKTGNSIITSLFAAKRFHDAMAIWNDLSVSVTYRAEIGKILEGGFESDIPRNSDQAFGWQVKTAPEPQISIDTYKKHGGSRSLQLVFRVRSQLEEIGVSQLVAVTPSTEYDLEYYVKTEGLQSGATPMIQIFDAADNAVLATSSEAPHGNNDWQPVSLHFKTGDKAQAVLLRVTRSTCGEDSSCPIFGTLWYDDFNLTHRN
jgi:tetratricopeptide (TPR) repeat protein